MDEGRAGSGGAPARPSPRYRGHHRADARHLYESLGYDASVATYLRKRL
jgi:hypothetical protein